MIKRSKPIKRSPLRKISRKRASGKADYKKAYTEQDREIMDSMGYIPCSSCGVVLVDGSGKSVRPCGHSHNMPVKHFPELEADPKNFSLRCQDWMGRRGCHEKLDTPDFKAILYFNDFHELMAYRKEHDVNAYNQWVTQLKAIGYEEYDYID